MTDSPQPSVPVADAPDPAIGARSARRRTFPRRVTGRDVVAMFLAVVLVPALAVVLVVVAGAGFGQRWLFGVVVPLATGVSYGGVWLALMGRGWSWRDLGFVRATRSLWNLLWEVPLVWIAALFLTAIVGSQAGLDPSGPTASSSAEALELGVGALLLMAVCVTFLVPALEEILFRRVVFGWLEQRHGVTAAVAGSALAFGLVHIAPPIILLQILIGLGAATLVRLHRTLWASLALHALNNGIVTVIVIASVR
ncbi:MAG: type II CAAX endopeptidase family protein [Nocardioidaceae bacterium]